MGQADDNKKRETLMRYQVQARHFEIANKGAIFLHCLPAHRDEEVSAEVIDSGYSLVFEQAENRLHAQKAVMALLMK
jgi:ornithine carbamoyltransferase